jgi:hypothetical protein
VNNINSIVYDLKAFCTEYSPLILSTLGIEIQGSGIVFSETGY